MARLLLVLAGLCLTVPLSGCTGLFFFPMHPWVRTPAHLGLEYDNIFFTSEDGTRLHGWFLPAAGEDPARGTVVFLHGNAENVSTHIASVHWLPERGFNVFLFDYRGYGSSAGNAELEGALGDVRAGVRRALQRPEVSSGRVVVWGQSLGAAMTPAALAECDCRKHLAAVVLDSSFSGFRRIAREKLAQVWLTWPFQYPLSWTVADNASPVDYVGRLSPLPVLVIHNTGDQTIPYRHAKRLYAAARAPKALWLIPGGKHIQTTRSAVVRDELVEYFTRQIGEESR
jgi:hypothetical protein